MIFQLSVSQVLALQEYTTTPEAGTKLAGLRLGLSIPWGPAGSLAHGYGVLLTPEPVRGKVGACLASLQQKQRKSLTGNLGT